MTDVNSVTLNSHFNVYNKSHSSIPPMTDVNSDTLNSHFNVYNEGLLCLVDGVMQDPRCYPRTRQSIAYTDAKGLLAGFLTLVVVLSSIRWKWHAITGLVYRLRLLIFGMLAMVVYRTTLMAKFVGWCLRYAISFVCTYRYGIVENDMCIDTTLNNASWFLTGVFCCIIGLMTFSTQSRHSDDLNRIPRMLHNPQNDPFTTPPTRRRHGPR